MSGNGTHMVVDSDAHVVETEHTWDYLDASEKKFRPQLFGGPEDLTTQYWVLDGKVLGFRFQSLSEQQLDEVSEKAGRHMQTPKEARELRDVQLRVDHLDELGIDVQILYNTMWIEQVTDHADAEIALCGSWNRWMADVWKQGGGRLRWVCVVPAMTMNEALEQIRFARENGAVGVCLRPFEGGRHLVDPYFYPIFDEAQRLDMMMGIHIAIGSPRMATQFRPRYDSGGGLPVFRIPTVSQCFTVMMSEVPKVFPDLRWGFIESSAQWVPWVVNETIRRSGTAEYPRDPMKAFNIYVSAQTDDDFPYVLKYAGDDNIVIGTDYGHTDASSEVDAFTIFNGNDTISAEQKRKILSDNGRALYGL